MNHLLTGAAILALLASPALAQSSTPQTRPTPQMNDNSNTNQNSTASQNLVAAQKIKQDLKNAGFTDVKVVAESFVVQARSRDGDPVLMTIGPHGMSVFEAMNSKNPGSDQSTTGSTSSPNPANSGSQDNSSSQAK